MFETPDYSKQLDELSHTSVFASTRVDAKSMHERVTEESIKGFSELEKRCPETASYCISYVDMVTGIDDQIGGEIEGFYLVGSYPRGNWRVDGGSDIDIILRMRDGVSVERFSEITSAIMERLENHPDEQFKEKMKENFGLVVNNDWRTEVRKRRDSELASRDLRISNAKGKEFEQVIFQKAMKSWKEYLLNWYINYKPLSLMLT